MSIATAPRLSRGKQLLASVGIVAATLSGVGVAQVATAEPAQAAFHQVCNNTGRDAIINNQVTPPGICRSSHAAHSYVKSFANGYARRVHDGAMRNLPFNTTVALPGDGGMWKMYAS